MLKYLSNLCLEVNFMAVHEIILGIVLILLSVAIIVLVLLQEGKSAGLLMLFKKLPVTLNGPRGYNEAINTKGGINVKEINPSTMESKLVLITKIIAISFFVLALVATLLLLFL